MEIFRLHPRKWIISTHFWNSHLVRLSAISSISVAQTDDHSLKFPITFKSSTFWMPALIQPKQSFRLHSNLSHSENRHRYSWSPAPRVGYSPLNWLTLSSTTQVPEQSDIATAYSSIVHESFTLLPKRQCKCRILEHHLDNSISNSQAPSKFILYSKFILSCFNTSGL